MKLLKQKWSGEIYVWTADLAKRSDMEEFVREAAPAPEPEPVVEPVEEVVEQAPARKRGYVKKALAAKAAELANDH